MCYKMVICEQQYCVTSRPVLCAETQKLDLTPWKQHVK